MARTLALILTLVHAGMLPSAAAGGVHHGATNEPVCETTGPAHHDGPVFAEQTDCEGCEGLSCHVMPGCAPVTAVTSPQRGDVRLTATPLSASALALSAKVDETIPDLSTPPPRT